MNPATANREGAKTIVVMDDSALVLDAVRVVLEAKGFRVRTAATLDELEARIGESAPDMFILDVQMPEMFGEDVAQVLRDVRDFRVPILLYSSVEESALAERAREAGVLHIPKQAGTEALVARVQTILRERMS
jgi:DNA-binding response OmpR family regulator